MTAHCGGRPARSLIGGQQKHKILVVKLATAALSVEHLLSASCLTLTYTIEASSNLSVWTSVLTNVAPANLFNITDFTLPTLSSGFTAVGGIVSSSLVCFPV